MKHGKLYRHQIGARTVLFIAVLQENNLVCRTIYIKKPLYIKKLCKVS